MMGNDEDESLNILTQKYKYEIEVNLKSLCQIILALAQV